MHTSLSGSIEKQGNWLFKHRGYLPLLSLPFITLAIRNAEIHESVKGETLELWNEFIGLGIAFLGLAIRCYVIGTVPAGTSGRVTASQEAATLNVTGMYSIVRHPLYLGNYIIVMGMAVFIGTWWLPLISTVLFWPYYERIAFAEEAFLQKRFGNRFSEWTKHTPAFLPRFHSWQPPSLKFSWRTVLRREYGAFLAIIVICSLSEICGDLFFDPRPHLEKGWVVVLIVGTFIALTLRTLKRKSKLLNVEGRP